MIKLDYKKQSETEDSVFYRFILNDNIIIWFTLYDNKHIYSIGIKADNLFPVTETHLFADTDNNEPYYFKEVLIESYSLNYSIEKTKQCIKELELACTLAQEIEDFFKNIFLQEYVD